ncbi:MAG: hypothetical protein Q9220_001326 [cf. Caloplaca sp. 1 TL-2023]
MLGEIEGTAPDLKNGPHTATDGVKTFLDFSEELSEQGARLVAAEMKNAVPVMADLRIDVIQAVHRIINAGNHGARLLYRDLAFFLGLCNHNIPSLILGEQEVAKEVERALQTLEIADHHRSGQTTSNHEPITKENYRLVLSCMKDTIDQIIAFIKDSGQQVAQQHGGALKHAGIKNLMNRFGNAVDVVHQQSLFEQLANANVHAVQHTSANSEASEKLLLSSELIGKVLSSLDIVTTTLRYRHIGEVEGILAELQQPAGFQGKRTKQRLNQDEYDSSEAGNCSDNQYSDLDPQGKPDQDSLDDPSNKGRLGVNKALEYLKGLKAEIATRQQLLPVAPPPSLHTNIRPFPHQLRAAALCLHAENTPFKGDVPSLVVVPPSCGRQWMEEIRVQFQEVMTENMLILSVALLMCRKPARLANFDRQMEEYEQYKTSLAPKRPKVTLLSGIWKMAGVEYTGRYLGLDKAHAIKNYSGRSYAAIKQLHIFALLSLLRGHSFTSMVRMRKEFTDPWSKGRQQKKHLAVPKRKEVARLVRLLHACTLSRPSTTVTKNLPPLHKQEIPFELPKEEREQSNAAFEEYKRTLGASYNDAAYRKGGDGERRRVKWSAMIKATQLAFHPTIPRIM